jgi:hypothetical protein
LGKSFDLLISIKKCLLVLLEENGNLDGRFSWKILEFSEFEAHTAQLQIVFMATCIAVLPLWAVSIMNPYGYGFESHPKQQCNTKH